MNELERIASAADYIRAKYEQIPDFVIVLGSGLGGLADQLKNTKVLDYSEIPYFPEPTVEGHQGRLISGDLKGRRVFVMQGRFHYYEGYSMDQVVFPIRCMLQLGVKNLIVTNAAGSVDVAYQPGDLMLIRDHIKLHGDSPLRGPNIDHFGPRFNDMSDPYSQKMRNLAHQCAEKLNINLKEGVYFYMTGPSYETASEIRAIHLLGGHVVGMSTVPEVIVATHGGMAVLGIACVTNLGTGISELKVGHDEVIRTGKAAGENLIPLVEEIVSRWE